MNILALDIGTSSVKAAVLDVATDKAVGPITHVHYELEAAAEAEEVPVERLWQALTAAARQAVQRAHVAGTSADVAGLGLSVMTPALVLLDKQDKPLVPIWTHLDRRSRPVARQVWAAVGPEFLATTGNRPLPGGISAISYAVFCLKKKNLCNDVASYLHL